MTVRGGLIESSGGFGVDVAPVDQLELSAEMFQFGDPLPNLRAYGTEYPFFDPTAHSPLRWLFLSRGVEEALGSQRDYLVGGGLRLTDQDLQGLVGLAPLATGQ